MIYRVRKSKCTINGMLELKKEINNEEKRMRLQKKYDIKICPNIDKCVPKWYKYIALI